MVATKRQLGASHKQPSMLVSLMRFTGISVLVPQFDVQLTRCNNLGWSHRFQLFLVHQGQG